MSTQTTYTDIFSEENKPRLVSGSAYGAKALATFMAPDVDYDKFNLQADYKENQAANIELKAQETANMLRAQFNKAAGSYTSRTARRNVKVGEGSAGDNIEQSSKDLGTDMQKLHGNADFQAAQKMADAERLRSAGKGAKKVHFWEKISSGIGDIKGASDAFGSMKSTTTKSGTVPKVPVQPKKKKTAKTVKKEKEIWLDTSKPYDEKEKKVDPEKIPQVNLFDSPTTDVLHGSFGAVDAKQVKTFSPQQQAYIVADLKKQGRSDKQIAKLTGLSKTELASLNQSGRRGA